ncbi:MAG: hypothetical protein OQK12_03115 [Motiliproteus sp.]|nr:hypothetical protein [Motiliproteus sp.]MCW9053519.1 hypothetical protein [Motiliproteus sp.]
MKQWNVNELEEFGRVQLSPSFFMRDFLFSEISQIQGIPNLPDHPELAIVAGKQLCEQILEPLQDAWGRLAIRSAYRSPAVNQYGNEHRLNCSRNEANYAAHIWDHRDAHGNLGATACIVVPAFIEYFEKTGDWTALAWWIHEHIPAYHEMCFFTKLAAFNIRWYEDQEAPKTIRSYAINPHTGDKKALVDRGRLNPFYVDKALSDFYADLSARSANSDLTDRTVSTCPPSAEAKAADTSNQSTSKESVALQAPVEAESESISPEAQLSDFASRHGLRTRPTGGARSNGLMLCKGTKTVFSLYFSGTDQPGFLEVSFNPKFWTNTQIETLKGCFAEAEAKTSHKWPRMGFKRSQLGAALSAIAQLKF